jgi:hypothetical protein
MSHYCCLFCKNSFVIKSLLVIISVQAIAPRPTTSHITHSGIKREMRACLLGVITSKKY